LPSAHSPRCLTRHPRFAPGTLTAGRSYVPASTSVRHHESRNQREHTANEWLNGFAPSRLCYVVLRAGGGGDGTDFALQRPRSPFFRAKPTISVIGHMFDAKHRAFWSTPSREFASGPGCRVRSATHCYKYVGRSIRGGPNGRRCQQQRLLVTWRNRVSLHPTR